MSPNKSKRLIAQKVVIVSNQKKNSENTSGKKDTLNPNQMLKKNITKFISGTQKASFGNRRGSTLVLKNEEMFTAGSVERNKEIGPREME